MKKLLLIMFILLGLAVAGYAYTGRNKTAGTSILGARDISATTAAHMNESHPPVSGNNTQILFDQIKRDIAKLTSGDTASSTPQMQKIIDEIKSLTSESSGSGSAESPIQKVCSIVCGK